MKKITYIILFIQLSTYSFATNYYISYNSGNDSNTGLTTSDPKKTISAANTILATFTAGDRMYFEKGSVWKESELIMTSRNGTALSPIQFLSYGTGKDPIITTYKELGTFTSLGGNKYSITDSDLPDNYLNTITYADYEYPSYYNYLGFLKINGVSYGMGKYPSDNNSYLTADDVSEDNVSYLYDAAESGRASGYWNGAQMQVGVGLFTDDLARVTSFSGGQFNFTTSDWAISAGSPALSGHDPSIYRYLKYFLVNHTNCLLDNGDWMYANSSKTITVYWDSDINNDLVEQNVLPHAVYIKDCDYVNVSGIKFEGGYVATTRFESCNNLTINGVDFSNGAYALCLIDASDNVTLTADSFNLSASNGVYINDCYDVYINGIDVDSCGIIHSLGGDRDQYNKQGIQVILNKGRFVLLNSSISNTGASGIAIKEIQSAATQDNSRIIRGNIFENFCATVSDQAGIYSYYGRYPYAGSTKEWCKNILINSTGNPGWVYNGKTISPAIYPDEWENYVRIDSNIVFNVPACYYTHGTDGNSFKYNKAVNFNKASDLTGSGWTQHGSGYIAIPDRNGEIKYNEFVGLDSTDIMATYFHYYAFADNGMDIDYNKYSNIFDVGGNVFEEFSGYSESYHTFSSWKSLVSTWDVNSSYNYNGEVYNTGSGIDRDEWIKFPINDNRLIADTISLHSCVFEDIDGNEISGSVIIQPFDAVVLYYKSGNADSLALVESGTLGYLYDYTPEPTDTTSTSTISDTLAKINFTFEGHNATGWYSMTGGTSGNLDIGNGIFMTSDGLSAGVSGITGGLWDDYVSVSYMYQPNSGINIDSFMFTGINPDYSINIDIGSFRSDETVTENRTTYFWTNLSEDTLSVNSVGNQSILRFDSLNVSSEGSFTLYVMNTEGKYSYINGAIITQNSQTTSLRVNALNIYEKSRVIEHRGLGRMVIIFSDYKDKIGFTGLILNSNYLEMNGPYVICEGDYLDLECNVVDVDSFVLSSNQFTGSFDDDHYKYAIFTPSEADVSLGSGYIVGTVYKNLQVLLDSFLLTINKPPVMYVGNDATLGVGIAYGLGSYGGYWSNAIDSRYKNLNGSVYYYEYGLHDSYTPSVLDLNDTVLIEGLAYAYFGTGCVSARDTMSLFIVDLTNPSAPTNLDTVSTGSSYISVEWTTSTDNVGVTFYRLALNDVVIDSTSNTFYTFNGLSSSTEYELKVNATDSYYNYSNWSDSLLITTKSTGDYSLDTLSIYARYRLENDFTDEYSSSLNGTGIGTDSFSSDSLIEGTYSYGQLSADDRFYTPDLVLGDTFSISMWVNPVVLGGVERRLFSTHNNRTDSGFEAYLTNASGPHYIRTYTGNGSASDLVVSSSGSVLDSVWNHIVITFAKSSATGVIGMYINGINRTNSDPSTLGNFNSDSIIYFGADPDAANDLYAYIDDIQIYKYILNQNDVTSLYSSPGDTILKIVDVEYSPTVVYKASNPNPANGAVSVDKDDNISWTGSDTSYVYVSYDNVIDTADYLIKTTSKSYSLPTLTYGDTVFWKINTSYDGGYLLGYEWYFVVQDYVAPIKASDPSPSNSSIYVGINPTLTWTATDSSFVYFGTDSSPDTTEFVQSNTSNSYSPGTLDYATTYYWKVSVHDGIGWVEGDTWSFRTINEPSSSYVRTFPGAVGYGSSSRAAYGGASDPIILIVDTVSTGNFSTGTNRGTFRWCVAQPYPRIILFEVGGVWDFTGTGTYRIDIDQPYLSIYGQSAPSPGFIMKSAHLQIETHDILLQNLKIRIGLEVESTIPGSRDDITLASGSDNIVIDHCSFAWGSDECISSTSYLTNSNWTISNCILAEPIHKGWHGDATWPEVHGLYCLWDGAGNNNATAFRNLFFKGVGRVPRTNYNNAMIINNINYGASNVGEVRSGTGDSYITHIGNINDKMSSMYVYSSSNYALGINSTMSSGSRLYVADNKCPYLTSNPSASQWELVVNSSRIIQAFSPLQNISDYPIVSSDDLEDTLLANVGAFIWDRDYMDQGILDKWIANDTVIVNSHDTIAAEASVLFQKYSTLYASSTNKIGDMTSGHDWSSANESMVVNGTTCTATANCANRDEVIAHLNTILPSGIECVKINAFEDSPLFGAPYTYPMGWVKIKTTNVGSSASFTISGDLAETLGIPQGTYYGQDNWGFGFENTSHTLSIPLNPNNDSGNGYTNLEMWMYNIGK